MVVRKYRATGLRYRSNNPSYNVNKNAFQWNANHLLAESTGYIEFERM